VACIILLNDGTSELLLNDGTSNVLLNSCEQVVTPTTDTAGLLAIQRRRKPQILRGEVSITLEGKIASSTTLTLVGQIKSKVLLPLMAKLEGLTRIATGGRIADYTDIKAESKIAAKESLKAEGDVKVSYQDIPIYKTDLEEKHNKKKQVLRDLIEALRKI
jgi:hypothetical protein